MGKSLYICDCVVISNFALARRLDLITSRYGERLVLPSEVLDEIAKGISCGHPELKDISEGVNRGALTEYSLSRKERRLFVELLRNLGSGEASCIAAARQKQAMVVTDDRMARTVCAEMDIPVTGTVGILAACCRDRIITPDEADDVLSRMIMAGFHSPVRRIRDIL